MVNETGNETGVRFRLHRAASLVEGADRAQSRSAIEMLTGPRPACSAGLVTLRVQINPSGGRRPHT